MNVKTDEKFVAFNREDPNKVFVFLKRIRVRLNDVQGMVDYYQGVLKDVSTYPDEPLENPCKIQVAGFESDWVKVPYELSGTTGSNIQAMKTVTPTRQRQVVGADPNYSGLGQVIVEPAPTETKTVKPTKSKQTFIPSGNNVGFHEFIVEAAPTQAITVYPQTEQSVETPASNFVGFSQVTVKAVDASIDSNIKPENIKKGITILGVTGTYEGDE